MMNFSEREGYKDRIPSQLEEISTDLKNNIFNEIYSTVQDFISVGITGYGDTSYKGSNAQLIWTDFFNNRTSSLPDARNYLEEFESLYNSLQWFEIYDLVEFLISLRGESLVTKFNRIFEKNNSSYRLINKIVQPISSKEIIGMVNSAYMNTSTIEAKNHLITAEKLYSRKKDPEFNNSCLESIKAIEGFLHYMFNNQKILGDNIKTLKRDSHNKHIVSILEKINAFRGDVSAHATKPNNSIPNREDAILIHCMCCSFINYLMSFKSKSIS